MNTYPFLVLAFDATATLKDDPATNLPAPETLEEDALE